jgi:hypothetical protein
MRVTIGVKIFGIAVGFADPGLTVTVLNASQGSSQLTLRWRKTDSNLWSHFQRGQRFRARHSVSRSTAPATSVLISENDDFEFPAAKVTSLAKARASC